MISTFGIKGDTVSRSYRFDDESLYNSYLPSWKTWSSQRCGGRLPVHEEQTLQGERILQMCGTDNLLSPDHPDGRSADISPSRPLSSLTRSRYRSPWSKEHHQEEIC